LLGSSLGVYGPKYTRIVGQAQPFLNVGEVRLLLGREVKLKDGESLAESSGGRRDHGVEAKLMGDPPNALGARIVADRCLEVLLRHPHSFLILRDAKVEDAREPNVHLEQPARSDY
jgi:hypothetical protein